MRESDLNQDKEEEYGEEEYESGFLRWMSVVVVLAAVAGFFALAYYAYHTGTQSVSETELATVEAEEGPMKEAPADPGGLEIPHQDKTVYDMISDDGAPPPTAERVLPVPEEPVDIPARSAGEEQTQTWSSSQTEDPPSAPGTGEKALHANAISKKQVVEDVPFVESKPGGASEEKKVVVVSPDEKEDPAATTSEPLAMQPKIIKVEVPDEPINTGKKEEVATSVPAKSEMKKVPEPKAEAKPAESEAVKKETPVKSATGGPVKIQLGAFKSEAEAESTWKAISRKHSSLVGDHGHIIQRADLGAKGVFYRLQLTGYRDMADAKAACAEFANVKQGCFPVQ